ncbi:MAG: FAD-dependent oxidoreductase [Gammaproteobacteria bacterium]|jgi:glycerol-3-phosphate dehydrogenase|nr:hypothetical protein [Gammaproteobacteria bacterium]MDP6097430.1 FAD-dependent oxidoreductase [Gammaproteobacteria bacterium]MDP7455323.1 FAD-dependent oxidoreductase [Gammaproteobacteria bacterium]HJO12719.1 FAD-dependent oxidoreductase [Gammaproteobacteria bacterium]|tara:strand:+ start:2096 stop:3307 length:1212 start_codon:yes stop_codon:yes gene_type:complete
MTPSFSTDIVIFGGGIAGLWLLNRLHNEGYQAILFETEVLGGGQTIASQGIIHGGLKYALSGSLSGTASTIAGMPTRWRACLKGEGDVDISRCALLCDHYLMWSDANFRSRLKTFLGSKSLRGRIATVATDEYPDFFRQHNIKGSLYRLPDFVIDAPSLLSVLSEPHQDRLFKISPSLIAFEQDSQANVTGVQLNSTRGTISIQSQKIMLCAGEGNRDLIARANLESVQMQTRPLHMVTLKKRDLPLIYVHCIGDDFSLTPRLTITSHRSKDGSHVWYLGGELAESGVGKNKKDQLVSAKSVINELFPRLDLSDAEWDCFTVRRAEAKVSGMFRPDDVYHAEEKNIITTWPTKLTLTPVLADKVIEQLASQPMLPAKHVNSISLADFLDPVGIAKPHWDNQTS